MRLYPILYQLELEGESLRFIRPGFELLGGSWTEVAKVEPSDGSGYATAGTPLCSAGISPHFGHNVVDGHGADPTEPVAGLYLLASRKKDGR